MSDFNHIIALLDSGDVSPDYVINNIHDGLYSLEYDECWKIGDYIYMHFTKESMSESAYTYATRAHVRSLQIDVVANGDDDDYNRWGIHRDANTNIWKPYVQGKTSRYSFVMNKHTGKGWAFRHEVYGERDSYSASAHVIGIDYHFVWDVMNKEVFSPIPRVKNSDAWFAENRIGNFVVNKTDARLEDFSIRRSVENIDLINQLKFNNPLSATIYLLHGSTDIVLNITSPVQLLNAYIGDSLSLQAGIHRLTPIETTRK